MSQSCCFSLRLCALPLKWVKWKKVWHYKYLPGVCKFVTKKYWWLLYFLYIACHKAYVGCHKTKYIYLAIIIIHPMFVTHLRSSFCVYLFGLEALTSLQVRVFFVPLAWINPIGAKRFVRACKQRLQSFASSLQAEGSDQKKSPGLTISPGLFNSAVSE
jgi:hypothetical protein